VVPTPRFSLIASAYNVAPQLPAFIDSVDGQQIEPGELEVIVVDDGSSDHTGELLQAWAARRPDVVQVVVQDNTGQALARNAGLVRATGRWVTFAHPDDRLDAAYFANIAALLDEHPEARAVVANRRTLFDPSGTVSEWSPLGRHFSRDPLVRNLHDFATSFPTAASSTVVPLEAIRARQRSFDAAAGESFSGCRFVAALLLDEPDPIVGFAASAHYLHRTTTGSAKDAGWGTLDPDRYGDVLEFGYLDLLTTSAERNAGRPAPWVQHLVLHQLAHLFSDRETRARQKRALSADAADRFHDLMGQITLLLDDAAITSDPSQALTATARDMLLKSWRRSPQSASFAVVGEPDPVDGLERLSYRFTGNAPMEALSDSGHALEPRFAKTRVLDDFGRTMLHERIAWLDRKGPLTLHLDGRPVRLVRTDPLSKPSRPTATATPNREPETDSQGRRRPWSRRRGAQGLEPSDPVIPPLPPATGGRTSTVTSGPWVFIDRLHRAGDNAEHLFTYMRDAYPSIDAWFLLNEGCTDWRRLQASPYADRLVAVGSDRWRELLTTSAWLISSHGDGAVRKPSANGEIVPIRGAFVFLGHGVVHNDLSTWYNSLRFDVAITSTHGEHASVIDDSTRYTCTAREAVLAELPRFDRLLSFREQPPRDRDLVVVAPTWRESLVEPSSGRTQIRQVRDTFAASPYAEAWLDLLASPAISAAARASGRRILFIPHPNMESMLDAISLPDEVEVATYEDVDFQEVLGRCAVLVTDYSSVAFDAAYIDRPVVYYQFDREAFGAGTHTSIAGYFDYRDDGFGPVTQDLRTAEHAIIARLKGPSSDSDMYRERARATFPYRDGEARRRVAQHLLTLSSALGAGEVPDGTFG
jgi:CDP-Glycerol:Poly(glycerophosphate) glycerophosphotransferase/Glycosyl transferase family 2